MTPGTKYPKAPIVEAMVEVRFVSRVPWTKDTLERVSGHIRRKYGGEPQTRNRVDLQAKLRGSELETEGAVSFHQALFPSADGRSVIGVGENQLSVHVLAPYPGWEAFAPLVKEAVEMYAVEAKPDGVAMVGVRYIDQIGIPASAEAPIDEFFTCLPRRTEEMPGGLDGFHCVTQAHDVDEDYYAVLTVASVPSTAPSPRLVVLYDLNLVRTFPAVAIAISEIGAHAEFLHARQKKIFESSITDKTRELFR